MNHRSLRETSEGDSSNGSQAQTPVRKHGGGSWALGSRGEGRQTCGFGYADVALHACEHAQVVLARLVTATEGKGTHFWKPCRCVHWLAVHSMIHIDMILSAEDRGSSFWQWLEITRHTECTTCCATHRVYGNTVLCMASSHTYYMVQHASYGARAM